MKLPHADSAGQKLYCYVCVTEPQWRRGQSELSSTSRTSFTYIARLHVASSQLVNTNVSLELLFAADEVVSRHTEEISTGSAFEQQPASRTQRHPITPRVAPRTGATR